MNKYEDLTSRLLERTRGGGSLPKAPDVNPADLMQLKKFLSTAPGRETVRTAIDQLIANQKVHGVRPQVPHQELIRTMVHNMKALGKVTDVYGNEGEPVVDFSNVEGLDQMESTEETDLGY